MPRSAVASAPCTESMTLSMRRVSPTRAASATSTSPFELAGDRFEPVARRARRRTRAQPSVRSRRCAPRPRRRRARSRLAPTTTAAAVSSAREEDERGVALLGREVRVAARHREPVGLPDERAAHDLDGEVEIGGHARDHRELLGVLAAEVRGARPGDREQLGHDRGDAVEVGRAGGAAHRFGQAGDVDGRERRAARVHLVGRRREDDVDALFDAGRESASRSRG